MWYVMRVPTISLSGTKTWMGRILLWRGIDGCWIGGLIPSRWIRIDHLFGVSQCQKTCGFFAWQATHNAVPTMAVLFHRHLSGSDVFRRCNAVSESIMHCVRDCPLAGRIWHMLLFWFCCRSS